MSNRRTEPCRVVSVVFLIFIAKSTKKKPPKYFLRETADDVVFDVIYCSRERGYKPVSEILILLLKINLIKLRGVQNKLLTRIESI